jgi:hypothetical protein
MSYRIVRHHLHKLLPGYVNGSISRWQRWLVARWLQRDAEAQAAYENLLRLQKAVRRQPEFVPPPAVLQSIRAQIQIPVNQPAAARRSQLAPAWLLWVAGLALAFFLLWQVQPPGIVLEWLVQGSSPEQFLVYRAALADDMAAATPADEAFVLLNEIPAAAVAQSYTFTDLRPLPGQQYVYRVVAIDEQGLPAASQTIIANGLDALPGQIVLLSLALLGGLGLFMFLQSRWPSNKPLPV